jgi:predicted NAD/FAD-binding protein
VAVVGGGVAYLLQRAYDVTLYEAQDRLGGHAHTHDIAAGDGRLLALDSGSMSRESAVPGRG